jgi:sulfonate transport system permease protein
MTRLQRWLVEHWISVATVVALAIAWEIAAHSVPQSPLRQSPIVPPWEYIFGEALIGMSDYWKIERFAPVPQLGGAQTYLGAALALAYHSAITLFRVAAGLLLGAVVGVGLGLLVSMSARAKRMIATPLHVIRMLPLLAMIPLFQFWLGATTWSAICFVAYGVGVFYFVGTLNAVANLPVRYLEYARTLGASPWRVYASVVLPGIQPELFSSVFLTLGLAWSAVIGAEYIGVDSGIGRMIIWAEFFSHTGRMALVTLFIVTYACLSFWLFRRLARRWLAWMPRDLGEASANSF